MKVVMIFNIPDDVVEQIMAQDMHAEDLIDEINDCAMDKGAESVWHFNNDPSKDIAKLWAHTETVIGEKYDELFKDCSWDKES